MRKYIRVIKIAYQVGAALARQQDIEIVHYKKCINVYRHSRDFELTKVYNNEGV